MYWTDKLLLNVFFSEIKDQFKIPLIAKHDICVIYYDNLVSSSVDKKKMLSHSMRCFLFRWNNEYYFSNGRQYSVYDNALKRNLHSIENLSDKENWKFKTINAAIHTSHSFTVCLMHNKGIVTHTPLPSKYSRP